MKKRFILLAVMLALLLFIIVRIPSTAVERGYDDDLTNVGSSADLSQTGGEESISDTGVNYADIGQSFYARIGLEDPEKYMTVPDDLMRTTDLKEFIDNGKQIWHFTRQTDGSYKVRNVYSNRYLEIYNAHPAENREVFHAYEDNLPDQRWMLRQVDDAYQFITCCDTSYLLKGVNLYGNNAEILVTSDFSKVSTHFIISKLPIYSDYLATPATKVSCVVGGVSVQWNPVYYAKTYRVYRYNDSTKKWVAVKTTSATSFTDKSVVSGKTYKYTVKCVTPLPSKYTAKSITYIAAPSPKVNNTVSGPKIYWSKVPGAQAYRVFYKTAGSSWKTLTTTTSTSVTQKSFVFNQDYYYTVRCMTADGKRYTSAYNTDGVKNRIVRTPQVKVTLDPGGYQLNWNEVDGAYRYIVMIKSKATNWTWSKSVYCIYNNYFYAEPLDNQDYYFTVRCIDEHNNYISGYTSTKKYTFYSAPRVTQFTASSKSVKLVWKRVAGTAKYRVFSWNGQKWVKRTDTANLSATLAVTGTAEQNACFAVRCMDKNGRFISSFYETVLSDGNILSYHSGGYTSTHKF